MRVFSIPAAYERHLTAAIATEVARIGSDVRFRDDDDERIRKFAPVNGELISPDRTGRVVVIVVDEELAELFKAEMDQRSVKVA